MPDVNEVVVGKPAFGGGVLAAPTGTTLPTGATAATSALDVGFVPLGFITDDGLTKSEDRSPSQIVAWGGDTIATTQESFGLTWQFTVASFLNEQAAVVLHGEANVTTSAASGTNGVRMAVVVKSGLAPLHSWVFDIISGTARIRYVVPLGRVTEVGDTSSPTPTRRVSTTRSPATRTRTGCRCTGTATTASSPRNRRGRGR
jgi:hypothetical protein